MKALPILAVTLVITTAEVAKGQSYGYRYGGGVPYFSYHSSTAAEGRARGMADLVRSMGAKNLLDSEAAKNYEDARAKYLDNRIKGTETYFEMRRMNREYREAERGPRLTSEQLFRINQARLPDQLSPSDLDPLTGAIRWPRALQAEGFEEDRTALDELYASRAENQGVVSSDAFSEIRQHIDQMEDALKQQIREIPQSDYIDANNFLKSLLYAAQTGG